MKNKLENKDIKIESSTYIVRFAVRNDRFTVQNDGFAVQNDHSAVQNEFYIKKREEIFLGKSTLYQR